MERSREEITVDDLAKLLIFARTDIDSFFKRNPKYIDAYRNRETLVALGQGAALHYINKKNGVNDFDVWFFCPRLERPLPYRRRGIVDFCESKFGVHPKDIGFKGRRIDVLMRAGYHFNHGSPEQCLVKYLELSTTTTAKMLSKKAMIGLWPKGLLGKVLWSHNITLQPSKNRDAFLSG